VKCAATELLEQLTNGREHTEEFYARKQIAVETLQKRVKFIESEMQTSLEHLQEVVSATEQAFTIAALASMGM
jgi:predicted ATP-grasp superfamily ATP-dependent carboligase